MKLSLNLEGSKTIIILELEKCLKEIKEMEDKK